MYRRWAQTDYQNKHYNINQKWLQHVQKMGTNRLSKQALQYKPKGRRNIGQPRMRWREQHHLEDKGTGNTPNPSGTWWWWWWCWWWRRRQHITGPCCDWVGSSAHCHISTSRYFQWTVLISFPDEMVVCILRRTSVRYLCRPFRLPWVRHRSSAWRRIQIRYFSLHIFLSLLWWFSSKCAFHSSSTKPQDYQVHVSIRKGHHRVW